MAGSRRDSAILVWRRLAVVGAISRGLASRRTAPSRLLEPSLSLSLHWLRQTGEPQSSLTCCKKKQSPCQRRPAPKGARNARNPAGDAQLRDSGQDSAAAVWCGMHRCRAAIAHCRDNFSGSRTEISTVQARLLIDCAAHKDWANRKFSVLGFLLRSLAHMM